MNKSYEAPRVLNFRPRARPSATSTASVAGTPTDGQVVVGRFGRQIGTVTKPAPAALSDKLPPITPRLLIVDGDDERCSEMGELFEDIGYEAFEASDVDQASTWLRQLRQIDVVLLNLNPDHDEMQAFVASVMAADASICPAVIVLARSDQRAQAIEALHAGAFDWQALPVDLPLLTHAVARATEQVKLRRVERLFRDLMDTTP